MCSCPVMFGAALRYNKVFCFYRFLCGNIFFPSTSHRVCPLLLRDQNSLPVLSRFLLLRFIKKELSSQRTKARGTTLFPVKKIDGHSRFVTEPPVSTYFFFQRNSSKATFCVPAPEKPCSPWIFLSGGTESAYSSFSLLLLYGILYFSILFNTNKFVNSFL